MLGKLIDRALMPVAPGLVASRVRSRLLAARGAALEAELSAAQLSGPTRREAAGRGDHHADLPTVGVGPVGSVLPELGLTATRSRALKVNTWQGAATSSAYKRNVVGTGITPQATVRAEGLLSKKDADAINKAMNADFPRWMDDPMWCDVAGAMPFFEIVGQLLDDAVFAGNGLAYVAVDGRRRSVRDAALPPVMMQGFEVEQLAAERDTPGMGWGVGGRLPGRGDAQGQLPAGHRIVGGVQVDRYNRPVAYHVHLESHPLDGLYPRGTSGGGSTDKVAVLPAERVVHVARPNRFGEVLSASRLDPVAMRIHGTHAYDRDELIAKRIEAFIAMAIKKNPKYVSLQSMIGQPSPGSDVLSQAVTATETHDGGTTPSGSSQSYRTINFEGGGQIPELFDGEEIQMLNPERPGPNYKDYMGVQFQGVAAGADVSRQTLTRDYTEGSYASLRLGVLDDWKVWDQWEKVLVCRALATVRRLWVEAAVLYRTMPAAVASAMERVWWDPRGRANLLRCDWQGPARPWIDPAKEMAAAKIALDYFLADRGRLLNRLGLSEREVYESIKEGHALREELGLPPTPEFMAGQAGPDGGAGVPRVHGVDGSDRDRGRNAGGSPRTQSASGGGFESLDVDDEGLASAVELLVDLAQRRGLRLPVLESAHGRLNGHGRPRKSESDELASSIVLNAAREN